MDETKFNSVPVELGLNFGDEEEEEKMKVEEAQEDKEELEEEFIFNFSKKATKEDSGRESPDFRAMHILDTKEPIFHDLSSKEEDNYFPVHDLSGAHLYTDGFE